MPNDLTIGEIRLHPRYGKVQLVSFDGGSFVRHLDEDGVERPSTRMYWESLKVWPEIDHLPDCTYRGGADT